METGVGSCYEKILSLLAGGDITASLSSSVWLELSDCSDVWKRLQSQALSLWMMEMNPDIRRLPKCEVSPGRTQ